MVDSVFCRARLDNPRALSLAYLIAPSLSSLLLAFSFATRESTVQGAVLASAQALEDAKAFGQEPIFAPVGWILGETPSGNFFNGSGVLIDDQWVLTAAHVVDPQYNPGSPTAWTGIRFSLSRSVFTDPPNFVSADAWHLAPGFGAGYTSALGSDLALVHLSSPVTQITPITRFRGQEQVGMPLYVAGYGTPGTAGNGLLPPDAILRAGTNTIFQDPSFPLGSTSYIFDRFDREGGGLELQSSPGDSGGVWLNEQFELVGITSFVNVFGNYDYGSRSAATSVSMYNEWIDGILGVPEPSSLILLGFGLVLGTVIGDRRRRCVRMRLGG